MRQETVEYTYGDGTIENRIRLYADDGKVVTQDGVNLYGSIDVLSSDGWYETVDPAPVDDEPTIEDKAEAYDILMGGAAE